MQSRNKSSEAFLAGDLTIVVGSSGGIGRVLLGRLAAQPRIRAALGLGRSSSRPVGLTDEDMIAQAARHVWGIEAEVRIVIDASGLFDMHGFSPEKNWRDLDVVHMARAFWVPLAAPRLEVHPPAVAAYHLRAVVDQLTAEAIGGFFDGHGQPVPW